MAADEVGVSGGSGERRERERELGFSYLVQTKYPTKIKPTKIYHFLPTENLPFLSDNFFMLTLILTYSMSTNSY